MRENDQSRPPLLVFADDWGRHPSSCQHLVRCLLPRYQICWVNTIGMRRPRLDWSSLARGMEKVKQWSRPAVTPAARADNLRVLSPRMWPWMSSAADRRLNRWLLTRQLNDALRSLPEPPVAVTTLPIVADLIGHLPVRRWVYYCVDDFGQWPGLDQRPLRVMEQALVERTDLVVAVSDHLRERLAGMGRSSHLLTHGVDLDHWIVPANEACIPELAGLERPLVVFWGVIDRRMDVRFVSRLADDLRQGTIVLIGPEADPDPALYRPSRVARLAPIDFARLPVVAREADVLVMPYADLPVTRAIQPLKLKEYLATGKPTVVRDLPATRGWADCADVVDTPEAFSAAVRARLAGGLPEDQRAARGRLTEESWPAKARQFEHWAIEEGALVNGVGCG